MKRALIFAGQGQQFHHMGQDLAAEFESVQSFYDTAHKITGIDVLNLDEDQINQTRFTQLALYVLEVAIADLLDVRSDDIVCGLSLGEYGALTHAGVIDFETGVSLIQKRGAIMDEAFTPGTTGMLALLKTDIDTVEALIKDTPVEVCNHNTESQIVIGGKVEDLEAITPILKEGGIRMIIPLKVSSVSHMSLLQDASLLLKEQLDQIQFKTPQLDFIANVTGDFQTEGFAESLQAQICTRTKMYDTMRLLQESGCQEYVEIGPKGSLSKFVKALDKTLETHNLYDLTTVTNYLGKE